MKHDELIEALRRLKVETGSLACLGCGHEHNCGTQGCAILRAAIEEIERNRWISVEERLPEEPGEYLVSVHQDDSENAEGYSLVLSAWYNPKAFPFTTIGWTLLNEWYDLTPRLREEITHWCSLPVSPEEVRDGM